MLTLEERMRTYAAIAFLMGIFALYAMLFNRLRKRRVGSAAVGSFYDMLERDRQKALEIVVDEKAEEQLPESAEGDLARLAQRKNERPNSN